MRIDVYHHFLGTIDESKVKLILAGIANLEKHMSKQDEAINAAVAAFDAKLGVIGTSLDQMAKAQINIAADEAAILAELKAIPPGDLTPENQAKLDSAVASLTAAADRSATQASAFQTLADQIPDVPQPPAV